MSDGTDKRVRELLMWARKHRIAIAHIQVGDVTMDLTDMDIPESKQTSAPPAPRPSIYEEFGGELANPQPTATSVEPTEEDEDD